MLDELSIENLGVLPAAHAQWAPGLTVLTGETGAGKTFLISGLKLINGGRADSSRIRQGQDSAVVEGIFRLDGLSAKTAEMIRGIVEDAGGNMDGDELVVSRSITSKGRSRAHVGGRTVTAGVLASVITPLLTVHGQHDQLRLLEPEQQLEALDSVDPAIADLRARYQEHRGQWRAVTRELKNRQENRRQMAQEEDRLTFALDEIAAVDPQPGEDDKLVERVQQVQEADELRLAAAQALEVLDGDQDQGAAASALVGQALGALGKSSEATLAGCAARLRAVQEELTDIAGELARFVESLDVEPGELARLLERQAALAELTRKYAPTIDGVLHWQEQARAQLAGLDTSSEALEELAKQAQEYGAKTREAAAKLTAARVRAAQELGQLVTAEVRRLAMPKASVEIRVTQGSAFKASGVDEVEFMLKAHDSAQARPIAQAASGGELSRIMLALEVVLSSDRGGTTIVFDEVDAGVGGRAAIEIGRCLMRLSRHCQVIVVTHLPQVAAYADQHLLVTKQVDGGVTSMVKALDDDDRVAELARMLAGLDHTETGRAHAQELLATARAERDELGA